MNEFMTKIKQKDVTLPFYAAIIIGLLTHAYLFVNKFPNADAMDSFWFDQNMVTSGRWFLTIACGISSYFDLNWVNGVLSIFYLALTAVILTKVLKIQTHTVRVLIAGLLVTFPAVTATFAYLYTADGYMLGLLLAVLAVYLTFKGRFGFLGGAVCLAFSLGIYQTYLSVTILLCIYLVMRSCLCAEPIKETAQKGVKFLLMGIGGGGLYYVILKICLYLQGKELDTYQGISTAGQISPEKLPEMIYRVYYDFAAFAVKGNILANNRFSMVSMVLLTVMVLAAMLWLFLRSGAYKKWYRIPILLIFIGILPIATNIILLVSEQAEYHLLMRFQWGLYPILMLAGVETALQSSVPQEKDKDHTKRKRVINLCAWVSLLIAAILIYSNIVTANIAYFNMNERYEKTYAYCLRLVDRIEQTPDYVQGMPVAMIGVVSEDAYPNTDITTQVTERITGTTGSILLYKGVQYQAFMKHYLNFTMNMVSDEEMLVIYDSEAYREMGTFPAQDSVRVVDGVLYIKTE